MCEGRKNEGKRVRREEGERRARVLIPPQWGVFDLTDEPMDLPARDYRKAAEKAGLTEQQAPLLPHGATYFLP